MSEQGKNMSYKKKWYLSTWIIALCFTLWFIYGVPLVVGIILLILQKRELKMLIKQHNDNVNILDEIGVERYVELTDKLEKIKNDFDCEKKTLISEIDHLKENRHSEKEKLLQEVEDKKALLINDIEDMKKNKENQVKLVKEHQIIIDELTTSIERLKNDKTKKEAQLKTQTNKLNRIKEIYKSVEYSIKTYFEYDSVYENIILPNSILEEIELISPSVILKLHYMDIKDLRKTFKENDKAIEQILSQYQSRYTTKSNKAIYQLMVIALKAELQNILYNLKYDKLDISLESIKTISEKYLVIAAEGNQNIASTLTKFVGQIEYLFINAAKIEYNYYVKKEQIKQEQLAIRQQMREEAEERRLLKQEKEKIEREELKFKNEIEKTHELMSISDDIDELEKLKARILELQGQLSDITLKKDEITNLQNGKAGNVYIISNLGSFGDQIFKIGMTRRIDPLERINELGSASVPFKFDVHSFVFSDDAVNLENELHNRLNNRRVNKVNMRKEFFNCTIDELENLVLELDPTAEFNRTMVAEEYRQSLSTVENYTVNHWENEGYNELGEDEIDE
ncbi:T5orf172 domain-containing protein [Alkalibaculum bacchi]|uniref:T5orf172 domain-containing protein n=1 Tax=Alkalibaculum bacchi TaxID=645887 RepID=A0A366I0Y8_9FIRM|nr:GIY-YIG nuclease family protein [Alkalibaculum bacchi]RBP61041.1 T5orf172 domain-containing protein [Alkalibaculum bacchi]